MRTARQNQIDNNFCLYGGYAIVGLGVAAGIILAPYTIDRISTYEGAFDSHAPSSMVDDLRDEKDGAALLEAGAGVVGIAGAALVGLTLGSRRENDPVAAPANELPSLP